MALSRQEDSRTTSGRVNQKARTRAALLRAAVELVREGRPPSMPEAAERALVSIATAYRYFTSAEELWQEAAMEAIGLESEMDAVDELVAAAGDDVHARLDQVVQHLGWLMVDDQLPFRQLAKMALDRWFAQVDVPEEERTPVRSARRLRHTAMIVEPLRGRIADADVRRLEAALGVVVGTECMIALTDAVGLGPEEAKATMLDAARWLLAGALADLEG